MIAACLVCGRERALPAWAQGACITCLQDALAAEGWYASSGRVIDDRTAERVAARLNALVAKREGKAS